MRSFTICFILTMLSAGAFAQDPAPVVGPEPPQPTVAATAPTSVVDVVTTVADTVEAVKGAKAAGDKTGVWVAILGLVAVVIKFLLDLANGPLLPKGKALRWAAIILGCVAGGITLLVSGLQGKLAGLPAALMFLTGPLAVALHELAKDVPGLKHTSEFLVGLGNGE